MKPAPRSREGTIVCAGKILIGLGLVLLVAGWVARLSLSESIILSLFAFIAIACGYVLIRKPEYLVLACT